MMRQHLQLTLKDLEEVRRGVHQMADQLTERLPWW